LHSLAEPVKDRYRGPHPHRDTDFRFGERAALCTDDFESSSTSTETCTKSRPGSHGAFQKGSAPNLRRTLDGQSPGQ
jgi:hypothetical protein